MTFFFDITRAWCPMTEAQETGNLLPSSVVEYTDEIGSRIKSVIDSVGGLTKAGALVGVTDETIAKWRDGKVKPPLFGLATIAAAAGKSVDWIVFGPIAFDAGQTAEIDDMREFSLVPRLGVSASAGFGLEAMAEEVTERLAFRTEWLREMGLSPRYSGLLTCSGDSQDPVIKDGALMLVDLRPDQPIRSGNFYVIVLDGDVLVKLVNRRIDGTIELLSHNPIYPTEVIDAGRLEKLSVPGRVVWTGQKL